MHRTELIKRMAGAIDALQLAHPVRVAIDGVDAAGKTTLADELAGELRRLSRPVIRASADDFLNPRTTRYRQGQLSARGYYRDSVDYRAIRTLLLDPLGPRGDRRYCTASFDFRRDTPLELAFLQARPDAILVFDGIFLLVPPLWEAWDYTAFVEVSPGISQARGTARDCGFLGGLAAARERYAQRYLPGQALYLRECRPKEHANVVIGNEDPANPALWMREAPLS